MEINILREDILQLEKRLMTCDYQELDELLAEEFFEFGRSGKTYDKRLELEAARNEKNANPIKLTVTDFNIRLLASDVILATYRTFRHNDENRALRSSIWKDNNGKWQLIFHQGTPTF